MLLWLNSSVKKSENKKKIAIISTVSKNQTASSWYYIQRVIPDLLNHFDIDLFVPERTVSYETVSREIGCSVFHLHMFPLKVAGSGYYSVLYALENNSSSLLCLWYLQQYPGALVLHDYNFFSLYCEALGHGTDSFELNGLVSNEYGDGAIRIGEHHIRKRVLEVYAEKYPFLKSVIRNALAIGIFDKNHSHPELDGAKIFYLDRPIRVHQKSSPSKEESSRRKTFCAVLESPFSRSALEILKVVPLTKTVGNFPLMVEINVDEDFRDATISIPGKSQRVDVSTCEGLLVLGNRPYHGMCEIVCEAIEYGIPVTCEYSGEYAEGTYENVFYHRREDGLIENVKKLSAMKKMSVLKENTNSPKKEMSQPLIDMLHFSSRAFSDRLALLEKEHADIVSTCIQRAEERFTGFISFLPELKDETSLLQEQYVSTASTIFTSNSI